MLNLRAREFHTNQPSALGMKFSCSPKHIGLMLPLFVAAAIRSRANVLAPLYTLTRIYALGYIEKMESVFEIIAEPNRRAILSLLVSSEQSVGEIERQLRMRQPTVSKHLRVLREAGFVESTVDAQRRLYRLKPEPFEEVHGWLAQFRRFWSTHVDALERHLDRMNKDRMNDDRTNPDRMDPSTPTKSTSSKGKTKKTTRSKPRT